jgi:anti-anti-sigma factor
MMPMARKTSEGSGAVDAVTIDHDGDISIARIHHRKLFKDDTSELVAKTLLDAARAGEFEKLLIDFSQVEIVTSSFLGSLVVLGQVLKKQGRPMRIFGLGESVERVFEVAHLGDLFGIDPREAAARTEISHT